MILCGMELLLRGKADTCLLTCEIRIVQSTLVSLETHPLYTIYISLKRMHRGKSPLIQISYLLTVK